MGHGADQFRRELNGAAALAADPVKRLVGFIVPDEDNRTPRTRQPASFGCLFQLTTFAVRHKLPRDTKNEWGLIPSLPFIIYRLGKLSSPTHVDHPHPL